MKAVLAGGVVVGLVASAILLSFVSSTVARVMPM